MPAKKTKLAPARATKKAAPKKAAKKAAAIVAPVPSLQISYPPLPPAVEDLTEELSRLSAQKAALEKQAGQIDTRRKELQARLHAALGDSAAAKNRFGQIVTWKATTIAPVLVKEHTRPATVRYTLKIEESA